jgi:RNA polymerase sigma factor (sigma-70 family)
VSRDEVFDRNRPLLFSMAYRMTGSVMDAEDAVQEAYLRWLRASEDEVRSPSAYLSKVVTRLCIDRLRSARVRREQYVGPWLPEPLLGEQAKEIAGKAELEDSPSMASSRLPRGASGPSASSSTPRSSGACRRSNRPKERTRDEPAASPRHGKDRGARPACGRASRLRGCRGACL